jgi:hypothetical protein
MSGTPPFSVLKSATLTLNNTQINALRTSPQTLVPAAGPNVVIIPLTFSACLTYAATFTGGGKRIELRMGNNVDFTKNNSLWKTSIIDSEQTGDRLATGSVGWVGNYGAKSSYTNQPITIFAETSYAGGAGSTIEFTCLYYELTC